MADHPPRQTSLYPIEHSRQAEAVEEVAGLVALEARTEMSAVSLLEPNNMFSD